MPLFLTTAWDWLATSKVAQWCVAILVALGSIWLALVRARNEGKIQERTENSATVLETVTEVQPIRDQVSKLSPDKKREELSKWSR